MLCQLCSKADATIRITRIANKAVEELHVCEDCAAKASPYNAKLAKKKQIDKLSVENLLKDLLQQQEAGMIADLNPPSGAPSADALLCPGCGLDFEKYRRTYMLGCPTCYDSFGERLLSDIRKIQGAVQHVGSRPVVENTYQDMQEKIRGLRVELEDAVECEEFARAVRIRDEIKKLQQNGKAGSEVAGQEKKAAT
ncbi:hypothetical protein BH09SUM1_BH09SUM1_25170 [soil metagenome]